MPQDELTDELIKRAQTNAPALPAPEQARLGVPPPLVRAIETMKKAYPGDPAIDPRKINTMRMDSPYAWSTTMGATDYHNNIEVQPIQMAFGPQALTNQILAHEVQHVRQNPEQSIEKFFKDFKLPYDQRPSEIDAFKKQREFERSYEGPDNNPDFPQGNQIANMLARGIYK